MPSASILLNNFHLGGIADSKYSGIPNSFASAIGLNLHAEPGVLKVNQKTTKESGSNIDDIPSRILPASDGKTYIFCRTNGKIWERASNGTYTLVHTDTNPSPGILNAIEYMGYLYWFTAAKVGRWSIGAAWASANDAYASFSVGNSLHHPAVIKNLILYIGDGYQVAQIDETGTFVGDALDLETKFVISAIGEAASDILPGATIASGNVVQTKVFRWNTYAPSFTSEDTVFEVGVNAFLPADNVVIAQCGQKGNIYSYNGEELQQFKRIAGDWSSTNKAFVNAAAVANYQGLPLFGLSNQSGNPASQGVYSFGSFSANYPQILNLEYVISTGNITGVEIGAIAVVGDDILIGWKDTTGGTTYGVDKVDWTAKYASAFLETRVLTLDRMNGKDMAVRIAYRSLPANTAITLQKSVNGAPYESVTLRKDDTRKLYETTVKIAGAGSCQLKFGFTVSSNNAPEVEMIQIDY